MSAAAVLQVATEAYWHEGPEVSVNAICQRAGVSKPSLYREFGSEDGLAAAALEHYAGMVRGLLRELLASELGFDAKLDALIAFTGEDSRYKHGCLYVKMRAARLALGPKTQAKITEIEEEMLKIYTNFFQENRGTGRWTGSMTPGFAARYLHAQIGLAASERALGTDPSTVKLLLQHALSILRVVPQA